MEIILKILLWISGSQKVSVIFMKMNRKGCIPRNIRQRVRQGRGSGWSWIFKGGTSTFVWMSIPIRPPPSLRLSEGSPQNLASIDNFFPAYHYLWNLWNLLIEVPGKFAGLKILLSARAWSLGSLRQCHSLRFLLRKFVPPGTFPRGGRKEGWIEAKINDSKDHRAQYLWVHSIPTLRRDHPVSQPGPSRVAHAGKNSEARDGF